MESYKDKLRLAPEPEEARSKPARARRGGPPDWGPRNFSCKFYPVCLDHAARQKSLSMPCGQCLWEEDRSAPVRVHATARREPGKKRRG